VRDVEALLVGRCIVVSRVWVSVLVGRGENGFEDWRVRHLGEKVGTSQCSIQESWVSSAQR
jgi:hypothetical protein